MSYIQHIIQKNVKKGKATACSPANFNIKGEHSYCEIDDIVAAHLSAYTNIPVFSRDRDLFNLDEKSINNYKSLLHIPILPITFLDKNSTFNGYINTIKLSKEVNNIIQYCLVNKQICSEKNKIINLSDEKSKEDIIHYEINLEKMMKEKINL